MLLTPLLCLAFGFLFSVAEVDEVDVAEVFEVVLLSRVEAGVRPTHASWRTRLQVEVLGDAHDEAVFVQVVETISVALA